MSSIDSLLKRADRLARRSSGPPRHWVFTLADDRDIPDCIASQMGPHDTHHIDWVQADYWDGLLGNSPGACCVMTDSGNFIVSMTDGTWTRVGGNNARSRANQAMYQV